MKLIQSIAVACAGATRIHEMIDVEGAALAEVEADAQDSLEEEALLEEAAYFDKFMSGRSSATNDLEDSSNSSAWTKPKMIIVDPSLAEAKFRSKEFPILVDGEVVELAFFDEFRDWLLWTNWRRITVDGEATMASGYGKNAKPNKVTFRSVPVHKLYGRIGSCSFSTAGGWDKDVDINCGLGSYEFHKKIGDQLFEVMDFFKKKEKQTWNRYDRVLVACPASAEYNPNYPKKHVLNGVYKYVNPRLYQHEDSPAKIFYDEGRESWELKGSGIEFVDHLPPKWEMPTSLSSSTGDHSCTLTPKQWDYATDMFLRSHLRGEIDNNVKETDKSVEELLGGAKGMVEKGETVLLKLSETRNPLKRYDDFIVTDRQFIKIDKSAAGGKVSVTQKRFPKGIDAWKTVTNWGVTTAGRTGRDNDHEIWATFGSKTLKLELEKRVVSEEQLYSYLGRLTEKVRKGHKLI